MSLYDDMKDAIALLENVAEREDHENGPHTAIGDMLSDVLFRARHVRVEINWRENLPGYKGKGVAK